MFAQWPEVCFLNENQSRELTDEMSITEFIHKIKQKEEKGITIYHASTKQRLGLTAQTTEHVLSYCFPVERRMTPSQAADVCVYACVCLGGPGCVHATSVFLSECVHLFVLSCVCVCQYVCWQHCRTSGWDWSECEEAAHLNIDGSHLEVVGFGPS